MDSVPTDTWDVVEHSPTHFKLRDKAGTTSLIRIADKELESVP